MRNERRDESGHLVHLESKPATFADVVDAESAGLVLVRRIEQLRVELPLSVADTTLDIRPFRLGIDDQTFLALNNRAFAWHPDQAGWTLQQLQERCAEPWFDAEGFLLHELEGKLAGFCWTKIHPATATEDEIGEIFIIAVDPEFHGQGLGRALTLAGLNFLHRQSVDVGMLHVEHVNIAAKTLYRDLGFIEYDAHCWWSLPEVGE
ncbi:MAG: GNAT family N-acetyltransferase [Acidimicrobiales bacterium]